MRTGRARPARRGGPAFGLLAVLLVLTGPARGQISSMPPPPASGENASYVDVLGSVDESEPRAPLDGVFPTSITGDVTAAPYPIETGFFETIRGSLFGDVYAPGQWRPLSLRTFFSEGWLESWASAPAGQYGLTPRHGWLGAFNGVFYRLWYTNFIDNNALTPPFRGNGYSSDFTIFLPFSRRFELAVNVPFLSANGAKLPKQGYTTESGDVTFVPRFLLAETSATTQVFSLPIRVPTGTSATGNGIMSLTPGYEFWSNPFGAWVVRGDSGIVVPLNTAQTRSQTAMAGGVAAGRYFTPHDVPFGDLVFYAALDYSVPLGTGSAKDTMVTLGPGTRFHLGHNFFFLHYWQFPITGPRSQQVSVQFSLVKFF
jgi:hypothetical protein